MRPFGSLTPRGRVGRIRQLGYGAVETFGLVGVRLSLVAESFNTLFRVRTTSGLDYLLRVGPALRLHPAATSEVEAAWLSALRADTDIGAPIVLKNGRNEVVTEASLGVAHYIDFVASRLREWMVRRP